MVERRAQSAVKPKNPTPTVGNLACERRPISGGDKRQPEIGLRSQAFGNRAEHFFGS